MIQAVLFDMDGLMFDTERLATVCWQRAAQELSYPITAEVLDLMRGANMAACRQMFYERFGDAVDYDRARVVRTRFFNEAIERDGVPLMPGLFELLSHLRRKGGKMAVASSTARAAAMRLLNLSGTLDYFDAVAFGDEVENSKPAPDVFLLAARRLGVSPEECAVLEDSYNGIRAARAAKCTPIMVPDMLEPTPEITAMCHAVCPSLSAAIPVLDRLKSQR